MNLLQPTFFFQGRIGWRYDIPIPAKAVLTEMIFQLKVLEVVGAIGARGARGGVVLGALWNQGWWSSPLSVSTCWEGHYPKVSLKGQAKNVWQTMLRLADVISILAQWLVIMQAWDDTSWWMDIVDRNSAYWLYCLTFKVMPPQL